MMWRAIYLGLTGLVLAAVVHIGIVVLVPESGNKDAARKVLRESPLNAFVEENASNQPIVPNGDPFFRTVTCKFDLTEFGVFAEANDTDIFWSSAVFNGEGRVIYSVNRSSSIGNRFRMIVVNPVQMARLRQFQPEQLETSIVVESRQPTGFLVLRILEADPSLKSEVDAFLNSLNCNSYNELG